MKDDQTKIRSIGKEGSLLACLFSSNCLEMKNQNEGTVIEVVVSVTFGWLNYSKMENIELSATKFRHNKYETFFTPVQESPTLLKTSIPLFSNFQV